MPPAAAVHTDPSTASSGRFLDRDVEMRYSADWSAGGDSEAAARDERMSSHRSNDLSQFTRGPAIDTPHGKLVLCYAPACSEGGSELCFCPFVCPSVSYIANKRSK